jgi:hypothetical protein
MADDNGVIDPRLFQFRWDLNAECNWDEVAGVNIADLDLKNPQHLRWLIYSGLKDNVDGIKITDIGKMVNPVNSYEVYKLVFGVMAKARRVEPEKKADPPATG